MQGTPLFSLPTREMHWSAGKFAVRTTVANCFVCTLAMTAYASPDVRCLHLRHVSRCETLSLKRLVDHGVCAGVNNHQEGWLSSSFLRDVCST